MCVCVCMCVCVFVCVCVKVVRKRRNEPTKRRAVCIYLTEWGRFSSLRSSLSLGTFPLSAGISLLSGTLSLGTGVDIRNWCRWGRYCCRQGCKCCGRCS